MNNRLKLTEEDIERVFNETKESTPTPPVIQIRVDELPEEDVPRPAVRSHVLRVTAEDLAPVPPQPTGSPNLTELETLMFGMVNSARQAHLPGWLGSPSLRWHDGLAAVARGHSADMLKRQFVDHTSPEGVKVAKRIELMGIRYLACGENIGVVYGAASHSDEGIYEIHKAFMNQPRRLTNHRGNLLNPIWSHVGIGVAYSENGALVATQNFIAAFGDT